jgi:hypothetical protein
MAVILLAGLFHISEVQQIGGELVARRKICSGI